MSEQSNRISLGKELKKLRQKAELTLHQLKELSGVEFGSIGKYEAGTRSISRYAFKALIKVLQPPASQRRRMLTLYEDSGDHTTSSDLQSIIPLALIDLKIKRDDVVKISDITAASPNAVNCQIHLKGRRTLTLTVRKS